MNKLSTLLIIALLPLYANSQFNLNPSGQVSIGKYADGIGSSKSLIENLSIGTKYRFDTITMCKIYGPFEGGAGAKIAFGGDPYPINNKPRVSIGELGQTKTYSLQLHGYSGIYFTSSERDTFAFYKPQNQFQFNCDVKTTGIFIKSDERFKTDIQPLNHTPYGLRDLHAVRYKLKQENYSGIKSPARYGFIAQEVETVYPELVMTDSTGYKYVDYIGLIPLLVESLKTVETRCDSLENIITEIRTDARAMTIEDKKAQGIEFEETPVLYQNEPNPFSVSTEIECYLPYHTKDAALLIYDLQGTQKLRKEIQGRGKTSVTIRGSELSAGMYIYSMIADSKEIDSKRMILTD